MKRTYSEMVLEIAKKFKNNNGYISKEKHLEHGIKQITTNISTDLASKQLKKEIGVYISFVFDEVLYFDATGKELLSKALTTALKSFLKTRFKNIKRVLVVGLGNDKYACDSLGKKVVEKVVATKPFLSKKMFSSKQMKEVYTLIPGVFGTTGMETSQIIKSVCNFLKPSVVIVIDSMVAGRIETLLKSIQVSNTKLLPGGGVGNCREEISKETLGVETIAIGVPMVVNLCSVAKCDEELIVTPKDVELKTISLSKIISKAINKTFCNLTKKEYFDLTN